MGKIVDLHTHTTFSDGTFSPSELINYAIEKGLSAIAITDHDTVAGVKSLNNTNNNIEIISGIEISAEYDNNEIHIVGLYIDYNDENLNKKLKDIVKKRIERNMAIIYKLNDIGIPITYNALEEIRGDSQSRQNTIVSRAHFAKWLVINKYAPDYKEAFNRYLKKGKVGYVKREIPSYKSAIEMIKDAGGIPILAHPLLYDKSKSEIEKMVYDLKIAGLCGMECYYPTHNIKDTRFTLSLCEKYNLKPSGGSDFHGANKPKLDLAVGYGGLIVDKKILDDLKEYL